MCFWLRTRPFVHCGPSVTKASLVTSTVTKDAFVASPSRLWCTSRHCSHIRHTCLDTRSDDLETAIRIPHCRHIVAGDDHFSTTARDRLPRSSPMCMQLI